MIMEHDMTLDSQTYTFWDGKKKIQLKKPAYFFITGLQGYEELLINCTDEAKSFIIQMKGRYRFLRKEWITGFYHMDSRIQEYWDILNDLAVIECFLEEGISICGKKKYNPSQYAARESSEEYAALEDSVIESIMELEMNGVTPEKAVEREYSHLIKCRAEVDRLFKAISYTALRVISAYPDNPFDKKKVRKKWLRKKVDFVRHILAEYDKCREDPSAYQKKYGIVFKDETAAAVYFFNQYDFDNNWTLERCKNYVRKC
jgi:hypothetical protein